MKGECRLCGRVIETPADPIFDAKRDERERRTFFQLIALHIDPNSRQCREPDHSKVKGRMAAVIQDNGWFQRWRLLHLVKTDEPDLLERSEQWRDYLHVITTRPPETGEGLPEPEKPKLVN